MLINPLIMSVPEPEQNKPSGNPADQLAELAKLALQKTALTKGSGLVLVIGIVILIFILLYSLIPSVQRSVPFLTPDDIRIAFWADIAFMIVLSTLFFLPEIIKKFKDAF